jgi:PAS domain S-box-containing protein
VQLVQPRGDTRWARVFARVDYEGGKASRIIGSVVDIEALKQAADAREAERRRLFAMLQHVPAIVTFLRGSDMVVEFAHPRAIAAFGGRDVVGRPLLEAIPEHRDQAHVQRLRHVYETGRADFVREAPGWAEVDGRRVDTYWDSANIPVRDPSGRIEGVMTFEIDVTENVRAKRELEASSRAKDDFVATMSHELRTPLNAILGWATMLRKPPRDEPKLERGLEVIERNARAQARLVSDLLDVSRITSGKLQLKMRRTDVAAIVLAAADVVRPAAEAKGVRLVTELDAELGAIQADPDRLQQVVWNLLSNAVRFTPRGGRITLGADRVETGIRVRVEDTGVGIALEHLPHIFERFRQVDSSASRAHGGLGLGLAIVRHLVEAHGGWVEAHSAGVGLGASFAVHLPREAVDASHASGEEEMEIDSHGATDASEVGQSLDGVHVLAVDDDPDSLEVLRTVLEDAGATVTIARGAQEALDARGPFDVIVSDIAMPGIDGHAFMRSLRARDPDANVPAIALTAYARPEDVERAKRAGFQEHLKKPVEPGRLLAEVKAWARARGAARDAEA